MALANFRRRKYIFTPHHGLSFSSYQRIKRISDIFVRFPWTDKEITRFCTTKLWYISYRCICRIFNLKSDEKIVFLSLMQIWNHFEENRKQSSNLKLLHGWRLIYFYCFREFYYIQMEKYARQAVSEGVKNVDDLRVGGDSEIYRVLNLHYNRNNHIEVNWSLCCVKFSEKRIP